MKFPSITTSIFRARSKHKIRYLFIELILGLSLGVSAKDTRGIQGTFEVDPDSGTASLFFPLGPGIGRSGLRYIPALAGRFAPQPGLASFNFELSPGSLDWPLVSDRPNGTPPSVRWSYPDGTGGCADGPFPGAFDPEAVLARFGYAPPARQDHLPYQGSAPSTPLVLAGTRGEYLFAVTDATPEEDVQYQDSWAFPTCLLVVRNHLAYEFRQASLPRPSRVPGAAHYRLTAVRAPSGENLTFTYGSNGMDFQATWRDARVRVALDAAPPPLDRSPSESSLRISYEGLQKVVPGYTIGIFLRAEKQDAPMGSEAAPPALRSQMQVARVQADVSGETVEFSYGKAPALSLAGPEGGRKDAPTVLQGIDSPYRSLRLEWEPQAGPRPLGQSAEGRNLEPEWVLGVKAVYEKGAPTYRRGAPGSASDGNAPEAGSPSWVRQSRHFAFASTPWTNGTCQTHVRDRWAFQGTGRKADSEPLHACHSFACDDDAGIPTFEWDPRERILVPVPGEMTRKLDWNHGTNRPPDLHQTDSRGGTARGGLAGGMPVGGGPGSNPAMGKLREMAAQATAQGLRIQAEQEARRDATFHRMDAQIQAQRMQGEFRHQARLQAELQAQQARQQAQRTAAMVDDYNKQINEIIKQYENKAKQKEEELLRKEKELKRRTEELKRQSEKFEQQARELEQQAEELRRQAEALGY